MQTPLVKASSTSHIQLSTWKSQLALLVGTTVGSLIPANHAITADVLEQEILIAGSAVPDLTRCLHICPENTRVLVIGTIFIDTILTLLDCRRPDRYATAHIPSACSIHTVLPRRIQRHLRNVEKETHIVLYSDTGLRADYMAIQLRRLGYKNTLVLNGGYLFWELKNKPVDHCKNCPNYTSKQ